MPRRTSQIEVHKFGGASLADAAAVRHAVAILQARPGPRVVVVSAMAGVTDLLLEAAERARGGDVGAAQRATASLRERHHVAARTLIPQAAARTELLLFVDAQLDELETLAKGLSIVRELTPRTRDFLVARGERLSARLVTAALVAAGVKTRYVDAIDVVKTDADFGNASPDLERTDAALRKALRPLLKQGVTPVVPGFIGGTPGGEVITLGRGGSDLTATLVGRALRALRVNLWKDVPGLLTADPRVVPDARVVPQLQCAGGGGAGLLRRQGAASARTDPGRRARRCRCSSAPSPIPRRTAPRSPSGAPVLECPGQGDLGAPGQALVTVDGQRHAGRPGVAARTFEALKREQICVTLITQASSEHSISLLRARVRAPRRPGAA